MNCERYPSIFCFWEPDPHSLLSSVSVLEVISCLSNSTWRETKKNWKIGSNQQAANFWEVYTNLVPFYYKCMTLYWKVAEGFLKIKSIFCYFLIIQGVLYCNAKNIGFWIFVEIHIFIISATNKVGLRMSKLVLTVAYLICHIT